MSNAVPGLAPAHRVVRAAFVQAAQPRRTRGVARWAEEDRWVGAESGSPRPGKWRNATSPLAVEPMDCLDVVEPCRTVTLAMAAQLLKSEVILNWAGQTINDDPASMMLLLPSLDELRNWNSTKWQPTLDAARDAGKPWKVLEVVERARTGSTTSFKRFPRGFLVVTTAMSSKGLQGRSIKRLCADEVSEFPADAGGRGDPLKQAIRRGDAHDDFKALLASTPKELPACRITQLYRAGDQRLYYVACPQCDEFQHLAIDAMRAPIHAGGRVTFTCVDCSAPIDEVHKEAMVRGGAWIKTYVDRPDGEPDPEANPDNPPPPAHFPRADLARWRARSSAGRDPSFHAWQAYSLLKGWSQIWADLVEARREVATGRDPDAMKVFTQQVLGLAWDAAVDAPSHEQLFKVRGRHVRRGLIPGWACEVIGVADVQGDRSEWEAYAVGADLSFARFDWGVIHIDPLDDEAWAELAIVAARRWPGEATVDLGFDIFGVDSGGKKGVTERVYRFCNARHGVLALKGSSDADAIPLVRGKRRFVRTADGKTISCEPYLVGGWGLKSQIYAGLAATFAEGADKERLAGGLYNPLDATHEDFKQYVAEVFKQPKSLRAGARGWWERIPGQANERLDLAVYARALAWHRGAFTRTPAAWQALLEARARKDAPVLPLFAQLERPAETAPADAPPPAPKPPAPPITPPTLAPNPGSERRSWGFKSRRS